MRLRFALRSHLLLTPLLLAAMWPQVLRAQVAAPPTTPPATANPANQPMPTMAQLEEIYAAGEYRVCLQQAARVLRLTGAAAKDYDQFAVQILRGECLLQLDDPTGASAAFQRAAKSPDMRLKATGEAGTAVIRASPRLMYTPKDAKPGDEPISIKTREGRRKAAAALLNDELAANEKKLASAEAAKNLVPLLDLVPLLLRWWSLDVATTGTDDRVKPVIRPLGERARELISDELVVVRQRTDQIAQLANQRVTVATGAWWGDARRGLHTTDRNALRQTIEYTGKILETAERGVDLARSHGGNVGAWEAIAKEARVNQEYAIGVLEAE